MKQLFLLVITFLIFFSSTVFAQNNTYEMGECFRITFPDNFKVNYEVPRPQIWAARFENGNIRRPLLELWAMPISDIPASWRDINENKRSTENLYLNSVRFKEMGTMIIDKRDAKWSLMYLGDIGSDAKTWDYWLHCLVYSDEYSYEFNARGNYSDLENDRKVIDEVLASIKLLK